MTDLIAAAYDAARAAANAARDAAYAAADAAYVDAYVDAALDRDAARAEDADHDFGPQMDSPAILKLQRKVRVIRREEGY